jgi:hypothetical protein
VDFSDFIVVGDRLLITGFHAGTWYRDLPPVAEEQHN